MKGRSDRVHFAGLPAERRAIVTADVAYFRPLVAAALRSGRPTYGIVCISRRFPLDRKQTGRLVRALEAFLEANPNVDAVMTKGGEVWLDDPTLEP